MYVNTEVHKKWGICKGPLFHFIYVGITVVYPSTQSATYSSSMNPKLEHFFLCEQYYSTIYSEYESYMSRMTMLVASPASPVTVSEFPLKLQSTIPHGVEAIRMALKGRVTVMVAVVAA